MFGICFMQVKLQILIMLNNFQLYKTQLGIILNEKFSSIHKCYFHLCVAENDEVSAHIDIYKLENQPKQYQNLPALLT